MSAEIFVLSGSTFRAHFIPTLMYYPNIPQLNIRKFFTLVHKDVLNIQEFCLI